MKVGSSPRIRSSQRQVRYRESAWRVHHFEVWSGELVCRAAALRMQGSLLVWLGGAGQPQLTELAAGVPGVSDGDRRSEPLSTALVGAEGSDGWAVWLARRLAALLARPVFVCCGDHFDRFTAPVVERGLIAEIKRRPECF